MSPVGASHNLRAFANGSRVYARRLGPSLIGGLSGPVGLRCGDYAFQLAVAGRGP